MERLHQLLHSLDPQQVKVLKKYLISFSTRDPNTKSWELAEILLKDKIEVPTVKACSLKLYNSIPDGRIERLKNRLYIKVLDSLLIDINTNRDIYLDEVHPIQIRMRKKMILYELLRFTPLRETVGMEMIQDIISTAKQYEFYPILLDAMHIRKLTYGLRKGIDFFRKMNSEIAYYEKCKQYTQRAQYLNTELAQISVFNSKADKLKYEQFLINAIEELRLYFVETEAKSLGFFLKTFEMTLLHSNKKSREAKEVAISMIKYMQKNRTVGRKVRFGIWYGYIAEFEMQLGNFDSAIKYLYKAREYFESTSLNFAINKRVEVDAVFMKGDYQRAKELATELSGTDSKVTGDFRRDMMLYYKACCHFMLEEFRDCARLLNQKFEITRDKLGWEVNIRFMRIMTMIEVNRSDEALAMVETVGKHIERYQQTADLNERDRLLLKLFRELAREGFAFEAPGEKVFHYVLQLREADKPHSWEPLTPELVPIHNWVIKKYGTRFVAPMADRFGKSVEPRKTRERKKAKGNA